MRRRLFFHATLLSLVAITCSSCGAPKFDVPYDNAEQPTIRSIVERIQCEIRDMVRDDRGPKDVPSFHRHFLLNADYDIEAELSVEVNDNGGLAPSLDYIVPFQAAGHSATWSANAKYSQSRTQNFTENLHFSTRDIYLNWKNGAQAYECPSVNTNLAGDLGISRFVAMAALSNPDEKSPKGPFGGSIQFAVTKELSAAGPTWVLTRFKGPGSLASASEINTDKVTIAFAPGPDAGKPLMGVLPSNSPKRGPGSEQPPRHPNPAAYEFLQQLLTGSISSQVSNLQNSLR